MTHESFTKQKITVHILFPVHITLFIIRKMIPWQSGILQIHHWTTRRYVSSFTNLHVLWYLEISA